MRDGESVNDEDLEEADLLIECLPRGALGTGVARPSVRAACRGRREDSARGWVTPTASEWHTNAVAREHEEPPTASPDTPCITLTTPGTRQAA